MKRIAVVVATTFQSSVNAQQPCLRADMSGRPLVAGCRHCRAVEAIPCEPPTMRPWIPSTLAP